MIQRLAEEYKLDIRKWSAVSHVVALMYGQLAGCDSLNGIVDAARVHESEWRNIRGARPALRWPGCKRVRIKLPKFKGN